MFDLDSTILSEGAVSLLKEIEYYLQESCSWLAQIQQKKNCPKRMD